MDIKAKLRPFYVAKMLYEQTDEEHYFVKSETLYFDLSSLTASTRHSKNLALKLRLSNRLRTGII